MHLTSFAATQPRKQFCPKTNNYKANEQICEEKQQSRT
jgi:hypothetical protein